MTHGRHSTTGRAAFTTDARLYYRCLGAAEFWIGKTRIGPGAGKKFGALLFLTSEAGQTTARGVLNELLFGELGDHRARHSLRELIYQLKACGAPIRVDKDSIALESEAFASDFLECTDGGRIDDGLITAIAGGFLPGYIPVPSASYREWYDGYRSRCIVELTRTLMRHLERSMSSGDWSRGERLARACLAIDPMHEPATIALADCLALSGASHAALEVLNTFAHESGGTPSSAIVLERRRRRIQESLSPYSSGAEMGFAGRSAEMDLCHSILDEARRGGLRILCLVGDAGVGKTRIANEISRRAALEGWATLAISLRPSDQGRPLSVFADLLPRLLAMPGALGCAPDSLASLDRVIGRHETEGENQAANAEPIVSRITVALGDIVDAISTERPLVISVDDVQWLDRASASTLYTIACSRYPSRVCFLLTSRDKGAFSQFEFAEEVIRFLSVGPLEPLTIRTLLARELPEESDDLHGWMSSVCDGNPFFLQCLLDEFKRTGERFVVPRKLSEIIDHRIAYLSPNGRQLLGTIIRLGKRATANRLAGATGLPPHELYSASLELERSRLVRRAGVLEPLHWLIAESEQRLAPSLPTTLIHLRIATVLEAELTLNSDPSLPWEVAEHWIAAGEGHRAVAHLCTCAAHSLDIGRARQASELLLRAATLSQTNDREELIYRAIRSAAASAQTDVIIEGSLLLQSSTGKKWPVDIEIFIVMARVLIEDDQADGIPRLIQHMRDRDQRLEHRSLAGFTLLVICDHERRHDLAITLADDIRLLWEELAGVDEVESLKLRLIFQSSVGDPRDVPVISARLLQLAKRARCDVAADLQRKAGIGYWRAGMDSEAKCAFELAFANAEKAGLTQLKSVIAYMMVGMLQDLGRLDESDGWLAIANQNQCETGAKPSDFLKVATEADRAIAQDSRKDVLRIAEAARRLGTTRISKRVKAWAAGLELYAAHIRGCVIDSEEATRSVFDGLVAGNENGEMADFQVAILGRILYAQQLKDEARRVIGRYLAEYRRPGMALTYPLRIVAAELELEEPRSLPHT